MASVDVHPFLLDTSEKYHIEYRRFLSNHVAHGIVALAHLGATNERIQQFVDWYVAFACFIFILLIFFTRIHMQWWIQRVTPPPKCTPSPPPPPPPSLWKGTHFFHFRIHFRQKAPVSDIGAPQRGRRQLMGNLGYATDMCSNERMIKQKEMNV